MKTVSERIASFDDWRGKTLARVRKLILAADKGIVEELKWRGTPTWSHGGILCTGEVYKSVVKLTFAKGASLPDPKGLFNASLTGHARRAIDIHEDDTLDPNAFTALVNAAIAANAKKGTVTLLSGGNPQIAKGDGPVKAYIAAMPGWKREIGESIDSLIDRVVPNVTKAVRWNSPFYAAGQGYFVSYHCFTKYLKVTFFAGTSLKPFPPGGTVKSKDARWVDIHEGEYDETQMEKWIRQASKLPGWQT